MESHWSLERLDALDIARTLVLFFFPLGRPATWRMQTMLPESRGGEDPDQVEDGPPLGTLQAIVDSFTDDEVRLRDPVWRTVFRIHHRHAATYRLGRVFLAGDAAHVHSPAGAQGMNTGIQDAWNLAWKLAVVAGGRGRPALLASYEAERRPIGRRVLRLSDRPFRVATSRSALFRLIRTQVVPRVASVAASADALRAYAFRRLAQLEIHYRDSPIVQEGLPALRHGPHAGDRLPDVALARDDQATSLHRELAAPRHHLLLCGPVQAWDTQRLADLRERYDGLLRTDHLTSASAPGVLVDIGGEALRRLAVVDAAQYLVRPDGHVAYRARGTDLDHLSRYLDRWFIGGEHATWE